MMVLGFLRRKKEKKPEKDSNYLNKKTEKVVKTEQETAVEDIFQEIYLVSRQYEARIKKIARNTYKLELAEVGKRKRTHTFYVVAEVEGDRRFLYGLYLAGKDGTAYPVGDGLGGESALRDILLGYTNDPEIVEKIIKELKTALSKYLLQSG